MLQVLVLICVLANIGVGGGEMMGFSWLACLLACLGCRGSGGKRGGSGR